MKSLLPGREQVPIIITLIIVILLGAGYYFIYLPGNEKNIQKWKFRTLKNVDANIHSKIKNGNILLGTYLKGDSLSAYINKLNKTNLDKSYKSVVLADSIHKINEKIKQLRSEKFPIDTIVRLKNKDFSEPLSCINLNKQLVLYRTEAIQDSIFQISLTYDFANFIKPLLPEDVFDEYMVLGTSTVLYESETLSSGLDYSNDSLLTHQSAITGSLIKDRTFGGVDYKLFIQPVICDSNTKLYVIGLLSREHYQQGKTKLPPQIILFLITFFTGILVSFPIIKLYQLGQEDRLTIMDGISLTIVAMLLVSLLCFIFLEYNNVLPRHNANDKSDPKEILADTISQTFLNEIKTNRERVIHLDLLMASNKKYQQDVFNVNKNCVLNSKGIELGLDSINLLSRNIDLDRTFWLNSDGMEIYAWKAGAVKVAFHGEFRERTYFKKIINGQGWEADTSIYYLEPVVSWIDGAFITLISVPSKVTNARVAVLSFFVKSLSKIKLPLGYSFAMIDKNGKVLYHSKMTKNLQENLIDEFSERDKLTTCLRTASSARFRTNYFAQEYNVQVKAIGGGLPFYLVIFDNLNFEQSRDIDVYSFTFSMQFMLFALLIIQMLIVFFASAKYSVYQDQLFDTSWLGPKKSVHKEYIVATGFNLWIFTVLCIYPVGSVISRLFMLLFAVCILPIFLNLLYAQKYRYIKSRRRYKLMAVYMAGIIPVLIIVISVVVLKESLLHFLGFELICIFSAILILYLRKSRNSLKGQLTIARKRQIVIVRKITSHFSLYKFFSNESAFNRSFAAMIFSWLVVTCGLPVIIFFTAAYNYDQHLIARTKQFDLANSLANDFYLKEEKKSEPKRKRDLDMTELSHNFYHDSYWADSSGISVDTSKTVRVLSEPDASEDEMTVGVLNSFRVYQSPNLNDRKDLLQSRAFDFSFFFSNLMKQVSSQSDKTVTYFRLNDSSHFLRISSSALNFSFPPLNKLGGILCWLTLFLALLGMYNLCYSIINKLFALNLPDISDWDKLDKEIIINHDAGDSIFILGVPYSGKRDFVESFFKTDPDTKDKNTEKVVLKRDGKDPIEYQKFDFDLRRISTKEDSQDIIAEWNKQITDLEENALNLIIVDHFEHNFKDPYTSNIKLQLLEKLLIKVKKCKVIVFSAIHPVTLLSALKELNITSSEGQSLERWQALLGNYSIVIHRLPQFENGGNENFDSLILAETQATKFVHEMSDPAMKVSGWKTGKSINEEKEESLVFKLQITSYHFYLSVWQSLSTEEKFLLYDLAEDGLVNPFDKTTLCLLLDKGVIIRKEGRLRLFNKGFRHFILAGIGSAETAIIMEKVNDNRNWNKTKIPLALISIAILSFLLFSQHETSTRLITTLTALAGVIPVVINFLSSLGTSGQKSK